MRGAPSGTSLVVSLAHRDSRTFIPMSTMTNVTGEIDELVQTALAGSLAY